MTDNNTPPFDSLRSPFPSHNEPRVWLISSGDSPIGITVARRVLAHGDFVVAGVVVTSFGGDRLEEFERFLTEINNNSEYGWRARFRPVLLDIKMVGSCQAAIAEAIETFGRIDILLCCSSQAIVGTVEELAASERTVNLVRDQFETNYFGPVNIIRAALPPMRRQRVGHIVVLSGITAHIGTPGLGVYCAAEWALEGLCDSMAYEIAPFNIKLSIIQCSIEILILTNLVTSVPPIDFAYSQFTNHAPLFRNILNRLLSRVPLSSESDARSSSAPPDDPFLDLKDEDSEDNDSGDDLIDHAFSALEVVSMYPPLSAAHFEVLAAETVHAITSIGGHENPPLRHIVGHEGIASVKEKLKTISEELEDFIQSSTAVDITPDEEPREMV